MKLHQIHSYILEEIGCHFPQTHTQIDSGVQTKT